MLAGGAASANAPITGGTPGGEPAVVALGFGDTLVCSGTLIAPHAVLTAAHCVTDASLPDVIVGDVLAGAVHHASLAALVAPGFDHASLDHDLAIVIVEPTLGVAPVPYATTLAASPGTSIEVVGYGWTVANDPAPPERRTGTSVIDAIDTLRIASHAAPSQACEGDSGGPALVNGSVVGVASSGDASCTQFARHTRVDLHADFIAETLRRSAPGAAGPGDRCWYNAGCATGACLPALDERRWSFCAPACDHGSCPDGLACITVDGDARCRHAAPSPGAEGAECGSDTDCAGALCRAPADGSTAVCTQACFRDLPGLACPAAETCRATADGNDACFGAPSGGCQATRGDPGLLLLLAALVHALRGRGEP
jgi:Trypsin